MPAPKTPPKPTTPKYALGDQVRIVNTGEAGPITQRCENATREPEYRVRVTAAPGCDVFRAVTESDLEAVSA